MRSGSSLRAVTARLSTACPSDTSRGTRALLELAIRRAFEDGDLHAAATLAIKGYGPEIERYLRASSANADAAGECFSQFTEDLWKGLPGFRWRCSFRTWAYTLARHTLYRRKKKRPATVSLSLVRTVPPPKRHHPKTTTRHRSINFAVDSLRKIAGCSRFGSIGKKRGKRSRV